MFGVIRDGPEAAEEFYQRWNEEVRRHVPEDRLLEFSVKEGWEPLCKFLDVPHPGKDVAFPRLNDRDSFAARMRKLWWASHSFVFGLPALLVILAGYFMS